MTDDKCTTAFNLWSYDVKREISDQNLVPHACIGGITSAIFLRIWVGRLAILAPRVPVWNVTPVSGDYGKEIRTWRRGLDDRCAPS